MRLSSKSAKRIGALRDIAEEIVDELDNLGPAPKATPATSVRIGKVHAVRLSAARLLADLDALIEALQPPEEGP